MARNFLRALGGLSLALSGAGVTLTIGAPAAAAQGRVLGGFNNISTDDAGAQGAGAFLAEQAGGELASVDSAQAQSTLNTNYRVEIALSSGARWRGQMTRDRNSGEYSMMGEATQISPASDEQDTGTNDGSDHSGDDD